MGADLRRSIGVARASPRIRENLLPCPKEILVAAPGPLDIAAAILAHLFLWAQLEFRIGLPMFLSHMLKGKGEYMFTRQRVKMLKGKKDVDCTQ